MIYDSLGNINKVKFQISKSNNSEFVLVTWKSKKVIIWYKDKMQAEITNEYQFRGKWLAITSGIDIEEKLNASYIVQGVKGGNGNGLGLCSSDSSVQIVVSHLFIAKRELSETEIYKLSELNI